MILPLKSWRSACLKWPVGVAVTVIDAADNKCDLKLTASDGRALL